MATITYCEFKELRKRALKLGVEPLIKLRNSETMNIEDKFEDSDRFELLSKVYQGFHFYWKNDFRSDKTTPLAYLGNNGMVFKMRENLRVNFGG